MNCAAAVLALLVGLFLCTQVVTEARHRTLHRPICQVIPQKLDFELKVDYPVVLLQALLYQVVVLVVQLFVI
jgi:hypothetical protein